MRQSDITCLVWGCTRSLRNLCHKPHPCIYPGTTYLTSVRRKTGFGVTGTHHRNAFDYSDEMHVGAFVKCMNG